MLNQRVRILQIAAVSIMCLVLAGGAQGAVFEPSDTFPVPTRLYRTEGPTTYMMGTFDTEILSMSLSFQGETLPLMSAPPGDYTLVGFFDMTCEMIIEDNLPVSAKLSGPGEVMIVIVDCSEGTNGTFQTEMVSMELSGDVGGNSIIIANSLPSPGETKITELGGGLYHIDSFFDVFTELSVDGGDPALANGPTRLVLTPARLGRFEVAVEGDSGEWNVLPDKSKGGDGWVNPLTEERWIEYPQDQDEPEQDDQVPPNVEDYPTWWNQWFYNDPYDRDRIKEISLRLDYARTLIDKDGYAIITVNWSTTDWSLNPPAGIDTSQQPPLFDFDPANPSVAWVGRMQVYRLPLDASDPQGGTFVLPTTRLPIPYNPEWVSIDVRGYNFSFVDGELIHECVEDPDLPPEIPDITIEQLNWEGLLSSTMYSTWGRFKADYNLPLGVYYVNMAIGDAVNPQWVIHNLSIETPGDDQTLMAYFDLGIDPPTNVGLLDYGYSITNAPLTGPPPIVATAWVPDLDFQLGSEDGLNLGSPSAPQTGASDSVVDSANSGVLADKDKFVNQPQGANQCAPGAISNSLKYLQATGKIPAAIPTGIGAVGAVVGTTSTGTPSSWYKKKKTHYQNHVNTRWIEAPLTLAKIQDLVSELKDGQDIEVDLKGHVEVLAGIRSKLEPDGTYTVDLDLYDDNQTDDVSDPMHTSPLMVDAAGTQYVDEMELERFVIECPKDPPTITTCDPHFSLNTGPEWGEAIAGGECSHVKPMLQADGEHYLSLWQSDWVENPDERYPLAEFMEALPHQVYAYEGDGDPDNEEPDDGGAVMAWGPDPLQQTLPPGSYVSALRHTYGQDPDLSNSIITVVVTAPQFSFTPPFNAITQVSLGLEMPPVGSGIIRSWYWNCGNTGIEPIQWGVPTTLKIDTSMTGTAAATPTATNYMNVPGFDIKNVLSILVDENATWVGPPTPSPAPGGQMVFMWNYWHWLMISPKTTLTKGYFTKWSQGPTVLDTGDPPLFWGWDEPSDYHIGPIAADDWLCEDKRPISDFHWWGSFPGWREPYPPCHPKAFHLGIWTDTPANPDDTDSYSHPDELVWEHICDNYVWNFAGYDRDPRQFADGSPIGGGIPGDDPTNEPNDSCFQYNQLLSQEDWFHQDTEGEPNRIYWLSIAPIWDYDCNYQWGWKTRPHFFEDNAVSITDVVTIDSSGTTTTAWPPVLGSKWVAGVPLQIPAYNPQVPNSHADAISWDLAFELTTIEPSYKDNPKPGDVNRDGRIDLVDLSILAANFPWELVPSP